MLNVCIHKPKLEARFSHPWFQVILITFHLCPQLADGCYKVCFDHNKTMEKKIVTGRHIAYNIAPNVQLPHGKWFTTTALQNVPSM